MSGTDCPQTRMLAALQQGPCGIGRLHAEAFGEGAWHRLPETRLLVLGLAAEGLVQVCGRSGQLVALARVVVEDCA